MSFNTAKIINVYYKADRKPYDANGKPISYFGEDFNGANEATEIRFYMPEGVDLGAVDCVAEVKRANGDKRFDLLTKITNGDETYYRLVTNAWYNQYVGKVTIAFKAYFGGVTIVDGVITATSGAIYVSDIFHLQIAYAPSSTEPVPPFDPSDVTTFINALSAKLNVNNGIFVIASALPSLAGGVYDGQWFLVKNNIDGEQGRLYYIDGSTAIAVELELGKLKLTPTGNGDLTANTAKLNWEQPNGTIQMGLYNDVNVGLGEDVFYYGKASANITKGQAIQFAGYQGDHLLIKPAVPSEINANPKLMMGIAKHNITSGDFGYVLHFGKLDGVDTGSFVAGNLLWFASGSGNNGELTATTPNSPNAKILMCAVIKAETSGPANNGVIQVRITIESRLTDLQDVEITNIQNNDVLKYNTATQQWENTNAFVLVDEELSLIETRLDTAESDIDNIESAISNVDNTADLDKPISTATQSALDLKADLSYVDGELALKANASDVTTALSTKADLVDGKVPSNQLPSFVDDVEEYANLASFPATGEAGKIYVALDTDKTYRWGGSVYVVISDTLALGETSSTAYRGDRGKTAYDHSQATGNPHGTTIADIGGGDITGNLNVSGKVGIGTSSPTDLLQLSGSTTGSIPIRITNTNTAGFTYLVMGDTNSTASGILRNGSTNSSFGGNGSLNIFQGANEPISFVTNNTVRGIITGAGDVGIGTTSPNAKLDILGSTILGSGNQSHLTTIGGLGVLSSGVRYGNYGQVLLNSNTDFTTSARRWLITNAADPGRGSFSIIKSTDASTTPTIGEAGVVSGGEAVFVIDRFNNVGIGTTSPERKLSISNAGAGTLELHPLDGYLGGAYIQGFNRSTNAFIPVETIASQIGFVIGTTEAMRINASGNVGIGTTSPASLLHLNSTTTTSQTIETTSTGANFSNLTLKTGSKSYTVGSAANGVTFQSLANKFFIFDENEVSTRLVIDTNGNVGIGTTSPAQKLDVEGNLRANIIVSKNPTTPAKTVVISYNNTNDLGYIESVHDGVAYKNLAINPFGGDVGIGTTSPFAKLDVFGNTLIRNTDNTSVSFTLGIGTGYNTDRRTRLFIGALNDTSVNNSVPYQHFLDVVGTATGKSLTFNRLNRGGTEAESMRIDASGNVGIGTTSPGTKLHVASSEAATRIAIENTNNSAFGAGIYLLTTNSGTAVSKATLRTTNNGTFSIFTGTTDETERLTISSTGNVGIGNTSPSAALHAQHNNADTTPAIIANLNNSSATGNILVLQKAGSAVASFSNSGIFVGQSRPANDAKTANHTLTFVDEGRVLRINSSSDLTVTIPLNSGTELPVGFEVALIRYGTGAVTISPTSGVTLNSKNSERKISGQYASVALKKIGTDEWVLVGSLEA